MKRLKRVLLCMSLALGIMYLPACLPAFVDAPCGIVAEAATVKISKKSAVINVGATLRLKVSGTKKKIAWTTSKKAVATVTKKGVVTGKKPGKATITAKVNGKKYICKITVKAAPKLNKKSASIKVGGKVTLKVTGASSQITWTSSKKDVATVSKKGVVTGKKPGKTTIIAKVGTKKLTCIVNVKRPLQETPIEPPVEVAPPETPPTESPIEYRIGETWTVPGEWRFTVNSVKTHYKCNALDTFPGVHVVTINYTYWCDGPTTNVAGLNFDFVNFGVFDGKGVAANHYICQHDSPPTYIGEGASCTASETYILLHDSDTLTLNVKRMDVNYKTQKAIFKLSFGENQGDQNNPSAVVKENLGKLATYIQSYGGLNSSGNRFIKSQMSTDGTDSTGAIVFQGATNDLRFIYRIDTTDPKSQASVDMTVRMDGEGQVTATVILLQAEALAGFKSYVTIDPAAYRKGEDLQFTIESSVGGADETTKQSLSNNLLELAFLSWERTLYQKTGLKLADIGFGI